MEFLRFDENSSKFVDVVRFARSLLLIDNYVIDMIFDLSSFFNFFVGSPPEAESKER